MVNNPYFRYSKISEERFRLLLECFASDCTATQAARSIGISLRSANAIFLRIRLRIAEHCGVKAAGIGWSGGCVPACGSRLLGIFEWEDWLGLEVVPEDLLRILPDVSRGLAGFQWIVTRPEWRGYHALGHLDLGWLCHVSSCPGSPRWSAIEDLWRFTRERIRRFYGLHDRTLGLHMKECEFRFNQLGKDLACVLAGLLMANPL